MSVFVDRQEVFKSFNALCQRNNPHWLLLLDGVEGIGKTAVLHQLIAKQSPTNRLIHLDFSSPIYNSDPLALMNRLASELPVASFQQFTADLLKAYDGLQSAHIKTENKIVVNRGAVFTGDVVQTASGPYQAQDSEADKALKRLFVECNISLDVSGIVSNNQIVQIASVNLGKALRDLKRHLRDELTTRFAQIVEAYLQSRPNEQIFLFIDNIDQVQKKPTGDEYLAWFLNSLLGVIHRRFSTRLRAVLTSSSAADWPESLVKQAKQITLKPLGLEDVKQYLQQRSADKEQLAKGIFELTQGHPLCLVMATDLYSLAPNLGFRELRRYATNPFDSRLLVRKLFQGIVNHMPDEAMKKLLNYGPIFRVLDDETIENVLAVELGLAKDQILTLLEKLSEYGVFEESEQFVFRPIIREFVLNEFRQNRPNDPIYRKLNRVAYQLYGHQWRRAVGMQKNHLRYKMLVHEINLAPKKAKEIVSQQVKEALQQNKPELAYDLMDLALEEETITISPKEKKRWIDQAPDDIKLYKRVPESNSEGKVEDPTNWLRVLVSTGGSLVWGFTKRSAVGIKNYITSPLRKLESHLRRSKKLVRLQQGIYKDLTRKYIPDSESIRRNADDLHNKIVSQELADASSLLATNTQVIQQVHNALRQQERSGFISARQLDDISKSITQQNKAVERYNSRIRGFDRKLDRFDNQNRKLQNIVAEINSKINSLNQESEVLTQQSQNLFESGRVLVFNNKSEESKAEKIIDEIQQNNFEIKRNEPNIQSALKQFELIQPGVHQALANVSNAIQQMQNAVANANGILSEASGVMLIGDDNRTLTITTGSN